MLRTGRLRFIITCTHSLDISNLHYQPCLLAMTDFMHSVAGAASNLAIGFSIAPALYRIHMAWSEGEDSKARGHLVHSAMQALKHLEDHIKQLKSRIRLHQPP